MGKKEICDTKFILSLYSSDEKKAISLFKRFNIQENNDQCLEYEERVRMDDTEATEVIKEAAGVGDLREMQNLEKEKRNKVIKQLKDGRLSIRQIERLTGISFGVIRGI